MTTDSAPAEAEVAEKIRVVLADDHDVVREGTAELLARYKDIEVVGQATDGEEAVAVCACLRPDVVIMDISMPRLNGLDATRQIKAKLPTTAVLVLTAFDDEQYVIALLQAGAAGYLLKSTRGAQLVEAIRQVHQGESVLHPTIAKKVIHRFAHNEPAATERDHVVDRLSEREMEVLRLAARGLSNKEIAQDLVISIRTVQVHFANIFGKLQVGSRTEAVLEALRKGWISLHETV